MILFAVSPSTASDRLRVGKAISGAFTFTLLDVGVKQGFFQKYGLDIEAAEFENSTIHKWRCIRVTENSIERRWRRSPNPVSS